MLIGQRKWPTFRNVAHLPGLMRSWPVVQDHRQIPDLDVELSDLGVPDRGGGAPPALGTQPPDLLPAVGRDEDSPGAGLGLGCGGVEKPVMTDGTAQALVAGAALWIEQKRGGGMCQVDLFGTHPADTESRGRNQDESPSGHSEETRLEEGGEVPKDGPLVAVALTGHKPGGQRQSQSVASPARRRYARVLRRFWFCSVADDHFRFPGT